MKTAAKIFIGLTLLCILVMIGAGLNQELRTREMLIPAYLTKELETTLLYLGAYLLLVFMYGLLITIAIIVERD